MQRELKRQIIGEAYNLGCDIALIKAIRYSKTKIDLLSVAATAHGQGAERISLFIKIMIKK